MTGPQWRVTVRRPDRTRGPQIRDWLSLDLDDRLMRAGSAPGTLQIEVPRAHRAAAELLQPGAGLILETVPAAGRVEWSGSIVDSEWTSGARGRVSVIAEDDNGVLAGALAYPVTTVDVAAGTSTLFSTSDDVRPGAAEAVWLQYVAQNIGPAAGVARRRYSWLQLPVSADRGATVTARARMDDLLTLAQRLLIPSGLACRAVHADPASIAVEVWEPTRPARARYSAANLRNLRWRGTSPRGDEWIVGGAGNGSSRLFTRRTDTRWSWHRRERYLDASTSGTASAALAAVAGDIAEGAATEQVTWELVPTGAGARYGAGLRVGDRAQVVLPWRPEAPVDDVVRRVQMRIDSATSAPRVLVTVGWPDPEPEQVAIARFRADTAAIVRS